MAKTIKAWLGDFVALQLRATIVWKEQILAVPKIKQDPECRFSDDGSNLRTSVTESHLPDTPKVQLLKVISTSDPIIVLISDGQTSVRCTLSENALRRLEDEFEGKLNLDHKGDVFTPRVFTIISTPFGPSDRQIQFYIDDLQYEYSLRKILGEVQSVPQHGSLKELLDRLREIWSQKYAAEDQPEDQADDRVSNATDPPHAVAVSSSEHGRGQQQPANESLRSNERLQQSSPAIASVSGESTVPGYTQLRAANHAQRLLRQNAGPSLSRDGFEIAAGVNLAQPQGATAASAKAAKAPPPAFRPDVLNLFLPPQPANMGAHSAANGLTENAVNETPSRTTPKVASGSGLSNSSVLATTQEPRNSMKRKKPATQLSVPYGRRKIPKPQRDLLQKDSSWYPPPPGKAFPCPNVPVELIGIWNADVPEAAIEASQRSEAPQCTQSSRDSRKHLQMADISDEASQAGSESSVDSDPPLSWDESPDRERQTEPLPVDSTASSCTTRLNTSQQDPVRPSSRASRPVQGYASTPYNFASKGSVGYRRHCYSRSGLDMSQRSYDSYRPRPTSASVVDWRSHDLTGRRSQHYAPNGTSSRFGLPTSQSPSQAAASHTNPPSKSATPSNVKLQREDYYISMAPPQPPRGCSEDRSRSVVPSHDSRNAPRVTGAQQLPIRSPDKPDDSPSRQAPPRSSDMASVIRATQYSSRGDELEMNVPRPLVDPAEQHRERRRQQLGPGQRRKWLQDNYVPCSDRRASIDGVYQIYIKRHTRDRVTIRDFRESVFSVFPGARGIQHKDSADQRTAPAPVGLSQLDGATDPADDNATVMVKPPDEHPKSLEIYEDKAPRPPERRYTVKKKRPATNSAKAAGSNCMPVKHEEDDHEDVGCSKAGKGRANGDADAASVHESEESGNPAMSVMKEFFLAYKNIGPGGAFAAPAQASEIKRRTRKVNVLGAHWDF